MNIRFTLVADGPTDAALMPILSWSLRRDPRVVDIDAQFAHPTQLPSPGKGLLTRVHKALTYYPCNLLFVHRDAEREAVEKRRAEIELVKPVMGSAFLVPVIPVRMTEAWLLIDEAALCSASGNPNGPKVKLPPLNVLEKRPDPKGELHGLLKEASGLSGRKLDKFNLGKAASLVSERISDFSPLLRLTSFQAFEKGLKVALDQIEMKTGNSRP